MSNSLIHIHTNLPNYDPKLEIWIWYDSKELKHHCATIMRIDEFKTQKIAESSAPTELEAILGICEIPFQYSIIVPDNGV